MVFSQTICNFGFFCKFLTKRELRDSCLSSSVIFIQFNWGLGFFLKSRQSLCIREFAKVVKLTLFLALFAIMLGAKIDMSKFTCKAGTAAETVVPFTFWGMFKLPSMMMSEISAHFAMSTPQI